MCSLFSRKHAACRVVCALALSCAIGFSAPIAHCQRRASAVALSQAYSWFDTLGFPNVSKLPFVNVFIPANDEDTFFRRGPAQRVGFLEKDDGVNFTVFYPDLTTMTLRRTPPAVTADKRVAFQKLGLTQWISKRLAIIDSGGSLPGTRLNFTGPHGGLFEMFVIARACAGSGHEPLANDLFRASGLWTNRSEDTPDRSVTSAIATDMAYDTVWRTILRFDDTKSTRDQILADYRDTARRFPGNKYGDEAKSKAEVLSRMVTEDRDHAAEIARRHAPVTPAERIADLVFELRDQNGRQFSQPGSCDVFNDPRGDKSPASQLAEIGRPAVPSLISAIDNDELTRSIEFGRNFYYSHSLLTVGEVALAVIEKIAHRTFRSNDGGEHGFAGTASEVTIIKSNVKSAVWAWLAESRLDGGKQSLINGTAKGDTELS